MEDQRQRVGSPELELVPEDNEPSFQAVNRVLHPKGNKPPLDLKFTQKIIEVFDRPDIAGKLLILGEPGSGKTTELLQLAQDLVTRVEEDDQRPVPVILELSSWNEEPLDKWVASQLDKLYSVSEAITQQWLANNQILLMLDGLDELGLTQQRQCIERINQFLNTTRTSELVVCCRREEYEAGQVELDGLNGAVYLEALKEDQIRQYFEKLNRLSLWENVSANPTLLELAERPLFLFMLVMAYQGKPIRNEQELFDSYIEKQLHDPRNQGTYKPGKEPALEQTRHYLVWLAQQLENIRETEFLIEGLQPTWLSSAGQIKLYRLSVGLINGLISGLFGGLILGLMGGLIDSLLGGLISGLFGGLSGGLFGGLMGGLFGGLMGVSTGQILVDIKPAEQLQWSLQSCISNLLLVLLFGLLNGLLFGLLGGLFGGLLGGLFGMLLSVLSNGFRGLIGGLLNGLLVGLSRGLFFGLLGGLFLGLISVLILGLIVGLINVLKNRISLTEKAMPNQGIRKSIQNALLVGLISGLIFGLLGALISGLMGGLIFGLLGSMLGMLLGGLNAVIQHLSLRILLSKNGHTPWNYARFLEHAVKHRFIQRTGGRYRFVHDLLRKHFAAMPLE